jgi:hypothetical protein
MELATLGDTPIVLANTELDRQTVASQAFISGRSRAVIAAGIASLALTTSNIVSMGGTLQIALLVTGHGYVERIVRGAFATLEEIAFLALVAASLTGVIATLADQLGVSV